MHYVFRSFKAVFALVVCFFIAACSSVSPVLPSGEPTHHIATIDIDINASQAEIEALYGAEAILFKPESGFAVLRLTKEAAALTTLSTEPNQDVLETAEVASEGWNAWAGGWNAWAGGWNAWAGGNPSSNHSATTFSDNMAIWEDVNLSEAHLGAPHLGQGIKVAVIDTGLDINHPAFAGKLAPASEWKDFVSNDNNPGEVSGSYYGHGTAVAGIVLQVAPNATILPIRVLDGDGKGNLDDVISAIDWAVAKGADVINLSLGTQTNSAALKASVRYAGEQGVFMTTSAGNTGNSNVTYPAKWSQEITSQDQIMETMIVSTGSTKLIAANGEVGVSGFASYGSNYVDIAAPAEAVWAPYPNSRKARFSGTSFAAPMSAGALALSLAEPTSRFQRSFWAQDAIWYLEFTANMMIFEFASSGKIRDGFINIGEYISKTVW